MRKRTLLAILLSLTLFWGCQAGPAVQTATVPTEPARGGFNGDFDGYIPRYFDGREKGWEEDILFLAGKYLTEHSYLTDANFFVQYQPTLDCVEEYIYDNSAYDPQKRECFIRDIEALIASVPERTDEQIQCELLRIVAALGDVHSNFWWTSGSYLPLFFEAFYREGGADYRVVTVSRGRERLLLAKLVSYNGIAVEEVVERVSAYVAHESDRALYFQLTGALEASAMTDQVILAAAGIIGADDRNLLVGLETAEGYIEERIAFRSAEQIAQKGLTIHPMESGENLRYQNSESYWWTMLDGKTIYVQLTTMLSHSEYTIDNLFSEVRTAMRDAGTPLKVILDFRGNGGGYVHESTLKGFVSACQWYGHDGVYILTDGECFSAGVLAPYYLRQAVEGALLVGAPTGQGLRFPANSAHYQLPNNGTSFTIGDEAFCAVMDWNGDALEPDVPVYQTLEDYENMTDSVIAWAWAD